MGGRYGGGIAVSRSPDPPFRAAFQRCASLPRQSLRLLHETESFPFVVKDFVRLISKNVNTILLGRIPPVDNFSYTGKPY